MAYTIREETERIEEIFIIDQTNEEYYCPACLAMFELECCCSELDND